MTADSCIRQQQSFARRGRGQRRGADPRHQLIARSHDVMNLGVRHEFDQSIGPGGYPCGDTGRPPGARFEFCVPPRVIFEGEAQSGAESSSH